MQKNSGETLKHCYPASLPLPLLFFLKTKHTHTDLPCKLWIPSTITSSVAVCVREWICSRLSQQDSRQWQQSSTPCCVTVTLMPIHTCSQQQRVTYAQSQWRRRRWFLLSPLFDSRPLCHYESCSPYSNGRRCRWALFCGGISIWYDELHTTVLSDMYDLHALMFHWLFPPFLNSSFQRFVCF